MRRDTLIQAVRRVVQDIEASNVRAMIDLGLERPRKDGPEATWIDFGIFRTLMLAYDTYGEAEKSVVEILGLKDIYSAEFWQRMSIKQEPRALIDMRQSIWFTIMHLPKVTELLQWKNVADHNHFPDSQAAEVSRLIHIIIPEDVAQMTRPARIITVIGAVAGLYDVCSRLAGRPDSAFGIIAMDSGSDKSIIFGGFGEVAAAVRGIITDVWDRVLLGRYAKSSANIDLIARSLPVLDQIKDACDSGTISPEEAEIMRRKTIESATGIVDSGAMTIELESREIPTPRSLIHENQLLLTSAAEHIVEQETQKNDTADADTHRMLRELAAEVERLKSSRRSVSTKRRRPKPSSKDPS